MAASSVLEGPKEIPAIDKQQIIADCKEALYCSKIVSYAQGMNLIRAASDQVPHLLLCFVSYHGNQYR